MASRTQTESEQPKDLRALGSPTTEAEPEDQYEEEEYDPTADRETVRGKIALFLVGSLVGVVIFVCLIGAAVAGVCGYTGTCSSETLELKSIRVIIELILSPLVGLVGAVTGFYYGEKSGKSDRTS
jgi:hypothetical protein